MNLAVGDPGDRGEQGRPLREEGGGRTDGRGFHGAQSVGRLLGLTR